jgi:hypothetical protein
MAKTPAKTPAKAPTKAPAKAPAKSPSKAKSSSSKDLLEQASDEALKKLQGLGIEPQLQSELEWCLGSYRFDGIPTGLREVAGKALVVLNAEKAKKTKGVTVKLIGELEQALKVQ